MLLSYINEAVSAKSIEKELKKTSINFSYKILIDVRSVTQTAVV
jgi:hypothetical protein